MNQDAKTVQHNKRTGAPEHYGSYRICVQVKGREVEVNMVDEAELKQQEPAVKTILPAGGNKQKAGLEPGPCPGYKRKGLFNSTCKHCGKKKSEH